MSCLEALNIKNKNFLSILSLYFVTPVKIHTMYCTILSIEILMEAYQNLDNI